MPALTSIFHEFKEKCIVKNAIITYTRKNDEFLIYVYCQANDVNIKSKENKLKLFVINMDFVITNQDRFESCPF